MRNLLSFLGVLSSVFNVMINEFRSINDLIVKSNDENLESLLQKPEDKLKFQKAVDEVIKESSTKDITLNGRNITISV
ncbi:hypothetical protein KBJ98_02150 [Flavobacterium sp. F-328]|uniref:Uncharacterized protein n=1 Tax=Flavobacterium erciyesense TaxID=2825842 RepID=A0ABS5D0F0_9FLAO|nr:hypothetical protein [Flavobacterium erciyesense]MBQ0907498.1 hypothetical protein [Flavobacterium erciyesense]